MDGEHPKWGPTFDRYLKSFDERQEEALNNYMVSREMTSIAHGGLIPLSLLETTLAVGENMHKIKYQHGEKSLPVLISTIRQYIELNPGGIFDYYYGYLCMKHVIRTICISALIESEALDNFLDSLAPDDNAIVIAELLSDASLDVMKQSPLEKDIAQLPGYLGLKSPIWNVFPCAGGLNFDDVDFLLITLWNDRRRLIILIESGKLPGFPALLFAFCHMMLYSDAPSLTKKRTWTRLYDVTVRSYLVGCHWPELHPLILCAFYRVREYGLVTDNTIDEQDARAILHAYIDIFRPIQDQDRGSHARLELDVSAILSQYVDTLVTKERANFMPEVEWAGLERLWLELDRERNGFLTAAWGLETQKYAMEIFRIIITMQHRLETSANRPALAKMFLEVNIPGLAGRVMLLALREASEPDVWSYLLEALDGLSDAIFGPMLTSRQLGEVSIVNWLKVNDHLMMKYLGMIPSGVPRKHLFEVTGHWDVFGPPPSWYIPSRMQTLDVRSELFT